MQGQTEAPTPASTRMKLRIRHHTHYHYSEPLSYSVQNLLLWPPDGPSQTVLDWRIKAPATLHELPDGWGNRCHSFTVLPAADRPVQSLDVIASGVVHTRGVAFFQDSQTEPHPAFFLRPSSLAEPHGRLTEWARTAVPALDRSQTQGGSLQPMDLLALASAVAQQVRYRSGSTGVETTALEAFDWGLGVCQDQAHVMLAACRGLGLSARYVSGYFFAEQELDLASHAWVDVCLDPQARKWMSIDVTHACPTDDRHVRLAVGSDYHACPPTKGLRKGGGSETMNVSVHIDRVTD